MSKTTPPFLSNNRQIIERNSSNGFIDFTKTYRLNYQIKNMRKQDIIGCVIGVIIGLVICYFTRDKKTTTITKKITIIDTIRVVDTVPDTIYKVKNKVVYLPKVDTINNSDTIILKDSVKVAVPISTYTFHKDSLYNIAATGYDVKLDKVELYNRTTIIEKTQYKKCKFGVGIQAGYGLGKNGLQPYIGIGIHYNLFNIK